MSFDIGDVVTLDFTDAVNGVLTDPTSLTLTITQPDGTTVTPTPTHVSAGTYSATFVPTQGGRHSYLWQATGTAQGAQPGIFDVLPSLPAVATPDDLSAYLGSAVDVDRATLVLGLAQGLCESIVKPLPVSARAVVLDVAARAYGNPLNAQQQTTGPFTVGFSAVAGGMWLTRQNKTTLRRLAGGGGAFTIDTMPATAGQDLPWWDINTTSPGDAGWSGYGSP